MKELILNTTFWLIGAAVVLAVLLAVLAVLAWGINHFAGQCAKGLASIVRFQTARYWVQRMEKEGLTIMQSEYRRMVRERKPKTPADYMQLGQEFGLDKEPGYPREDIEHGGAVASPERG